MKRLCVTVKLSVLTATFTTALVFASSRMAAWQFFVDVTPRDSASGIYQIVLPLHVMDKARADLADLRLMDANGREIPYALRIRRDVEDTREVGGRLFNHTTIGASTSEISVDLGDGGVEHSQVEIETSGENFRRLVNVEGSDAGSDWKMLKSSEAIYSFSSANQATHSNVVRYSTSRYRFLRVRVFGDERVDTEPPVITAVRASMSAHEKGELITWNVAVPSYQLLRHDGAPASSWTIDLGGKVPCDRLMLTTTDESFSRPFQLEVADDPQNAPVIASGELTNRSGGPNRAVTVTFDHEVSARKLRLLINDYSNPTLSINSIQAGAPARQLYFELKAPAARPLKLYFGNPTADAPHYDFEKQFPAKLKTQASPATVGLLVTNPEYEPPALPFTERQPWLIYAVLTISSVALALILLSLARATMRIPPAKR